MKTDNSKFIEIIESHIFENEKLRDEVGLDIDSDSRLFMYYRAKVEALETLKGSMQRMFSEPEGLNPEELLQYNQKKLASELKSGELYSKEHFDTERSITKDNEPTFHLQGSDPFAYAAIRFYCSLLGNNKAMQAANESAQRFFHYRQRNSDLMKKEVSAYELGSEAYDREGEFATNFFFESNDDSLEWEKGFENQKMISEEINKLIAEPKLSET